jgi:pimeloyl-ACP methyl ester carboxylesterase
MPFADFKKGKVFYTTQGEGRSIVLLHGYLESSTMWDELVPILSANYKVICIDLPGHGNTENFGYVHSMELMAKAVKAVLDKIDVRKALFIGHSMGGYVCMAFADLFPDTIKGILLFHSTPAADSAERKLLRDKAIEAVKKDHKSYVRISFPFLFRHKYRVKEKTKFNKLLEVAKATTKQGMIAALEGMKRRSSREIIVKLPPYRIHFILGKWDKVIRYKEILKMCKWSPNVSAAVLNESGHMSHVEESEKAFDEIYQFAKEVWK